MKNLCYLYLAGILLLTLVAGCSKPRIAVDNQKTQDHQVEKGEAFQQQNYKSFRENVSLTLVSPDECELSQNGTVLLCKYSRQADRLRVVETVMGTNQVLYYQFVGNNLSANDGTILFAPKELIEARDQMAQAEHKRQQEFERRSKIAVASKQSSQTIKEFTGLNPGISTIDAVTVTDTGLILHHIYDRPDQFMWFGDMYAFRDLGHSTLSFFIGDPQATAAGSVGINLSFNDVSASKSCLGTIMQAMYEWHEKYRDALLPNAISQWYDQSFSHYRPEVASGEDSSSSPSTGGVLGKPIDFSKLDGDLIPSGKKESSWQRPGTTATANRDHADAELNQVYNYLIKSLKPQQQAKLRDDERAWIKWRDIEADRIAHTTSVGGSAYREDYLNATTDLIQKRTTDLKKQIQASGMDSSGTNNNPPGPTVPQSPVTNLPDSAKEPQGIWITGIISSEDGLLLFQCDKPVSNNKTGAVVILGVPKESASTLLPAFMNAAQKRMKMRLYGILLHVPEGGMPGKHSIPVPDVQFKVWKVHLPSDPDVLPQDQKIPVH